MINTPSFVIREILRQNGMVSLPDSRVAWPAYITTLPDGDLVLHNAIVITDLPPLVESPRAMEGRVYERFYVQIRIRTSKQKDGWDYLTAIAAYLDTVFMQGVSLFGTISMVQAIRRSSVIPMGMEEGTKRRFFHSLNLDFVCTESVDTTASGVYNDYGLQSGNFLKDHVGNVLADNQGRPLTDLVSN